ELADAYRALEQKLLKRWDAPLTNDFLAMIFYGLLRKLTAAWCGDSAGMLQNDLLCGQGGMISTEPARRVWQMAEAIRNDLPMVDALCHGTLAEISQAM